MKTVGSDARRQSRHTNEVLREVMEGACPVAHAETGGREVESGPSCE